LKSADLGYEDEKFCYMIFGKEPATAFSSRILRHPLKRSGHIEFTLCTKEGIKKQISSKKDGDFYKQAKKFEWGDCF
jgi:ribosomal protein RSM22 (predicted rRNA methylase)